MSETKKAEKVVLYYHSGVMKTLGASFFFYIRAFISHKNET